MERTEALIRKQFSYTPTPGQETLIPNLARFLETDKHNPVFILKGYAGTGKTTIVSALVNMIHLIGKKAVLLAPTGRAAKVFSGYSGKQALTIHKKIYRVSTAKDGSVVMARQLNLHRNALFIVDEASMIATDTKSSGGELFASYNLLENLIDYVFSGENCSLMLVGDTAQLPPVGQQESPALEHAYMKRTFDLTAGVFELSDVVRQASDSGILANATLLRNAIKKNKISLPLFRIGEHKDIVRIGGAELEELLNTEFGNDDKSGTVVICRSNKRANLFNREIRSRVLFHESDIAAGDFIMVVKNNYFWLPETSAAGFIANGDIMEIMRIHKTETLYGFQFADVTARLVDYPDEPEIEVKLLLDTITSESPALPWTENRRLYAEVLEDYKDTASKFKRLQKVKTNPYFNALQVKFSYALTCHKTQGGQWNTVFIDQGYFKEDMLNAEYLQWLYTALTRATGKVYLVNFNELFFID
ncbi:MAG: AAA family ATPase [Bacteroidota bacterium]